MRRLVQSVSGAGRSARRRARRHRQRQLEPGEPTLIDPGDYTDAERAARGIARFPATLNEALDHLDGDHVLTAALGPLLARSFLAVKRAEWAAFSKEDAAFEQKHHFWKF